MHANSEHTHTHRYTHTHTQREIIDRSRLGRIILIKNIYKMITVLLKNLKACNNDIILSRDFTPPDVASL